MELQDLKVCAGMPCFFASWRRSRVEFAERLDSAADLREAWQGRCGPLRCLWSSSGNDEDYTVSEGPECSCPQHVTIEDCNYRLSLPYLVELVCRGVGTQLIVAVAGEVAKERVILDACPYKGFRHTLLCPVFNKTGACEYVCVCAYLVCVSSVFDDALICS